MSSFRIALVAGGCCLTSLVDLRAQEANNLGQRLRAHCVDCHSDDTTEGEFSLQPLLDRSAQPEDSARALGRIRIRVANGEMPPDEADPLHDAERRRLIAAVDSRLTVLANRLRDDPGHVSIPRLTPYEYRNVIRDLSGGVVTDAGRLLPNEGGAGEGFANVGAAQVMTLPQYEKYIDAARTALRHLRVYPAPDTLRGIRTVWKPFPRATVDAPATARKEVVDEIIDWHVGQQQKWGQAHRSELDQRLGIAHAAYLEAAWYFAQNNRGEADLTAFASVAGDTERLQLAPAALKKWWHILHDADKSSPHAAWAAAWRELVHESGLDQAGVRDRCLAIVSGNDRIILESEDFAPPWEISFHEAREEVLEAAEKEGRWPFRIDIGDAEELFLVVTDAGDGRRGEYAVWRRGRFVFRDGSTKPWQDVVTILGARSGNEYPFGIDGEKSKVLEADAVGAKPPGALKFVVPEGAIVFEVDLTLDENRTKQASIQALVLKERPKSSSYVPGRFVFGGRKRPVSAGAKLKKEQDRALRKRNVSEANKTKIGLNAERNVFASWDRTSLEAIGGPWPEQDADKHEPTFPYHYTVAEVMLNATDADLEVLRSLEERLVSLVSAAAESELHRCAEEIVLPFARKAWRRELTNGDARTLLRLYEQARAQGLSFDSSVKAPLMLVLSSPHFIYKQYPAAATSAESPKQTTEPLSSHALATRVAFFLWGSLPDEELLRLAERDELRDVTVLTRQARRMLKDPRARSLATDFAGQVWEFSDFREFDNPDQTRFPEFTPQLRNAMAQEVETFLAELFVNDRPLTDILAADYTFANRELADHYGVDAGDLDAGLERVGLPAERGGLATMSLFLTKKSLPLRTSPVQRGVWVMENLLGRHMPNPPADVPSLSPDDTNQSGEGIREQLQRHRAHASCARCHDRIDPLGISLENFDPIGRWRDTERDGSPVGSVAETHDGVRIDGGVGLKAYLMQHRGEFIRHFNRKLLGYALGRAVHIGDQRLLDRMDERSRSGEFRLSALIDEIVSSPQFRTRRSGVE